MEPNDHDILIEVKTMVAFLLQGQEKYFTEHKELSARITRVETLQGVHETKIDNLNQDIQSLQKKSTLFDGLNAIGIAISTALGFIFRQP